MSVLKTDIERALQSVQDTQKGQDIVTSGMVQGLQINEVGEVVFMLQVEAERGSELEPLRQKAEQAAARVKGVKKVTAILTSERQSKPQTPDPHGMNKNPRLELPIKHIIAVASGKGGVGKSTVAANLAMALAQNKKLKVGLLDADIYGPSQPKMMGLEGKKPRQNKGKIDPLNVHNVKVMSIGFLVDQSQALIWRGPMVQTAFYQMLRDVNWGTDKEPLDVLILDLPPGTGDVQLTMAQKVTMAGAIIVSTPQDIALIDAQRAIEMFKKVDVPVMGMIENMSTHVCSSCGHEEHIFGHGGAQEEAEKHGVPFLGAIPLDLSIRLDSDAGKPSETQGFQEIARSLKDVLNL